MSLTLHRSARVDLLADSLASVLADPPADPFASELVVVPAKGVERWLSQRLSHVLGAVYGDGVAANIEFRSPRALMSAVLGDDDVWHPDRAVWPLLEVIDASLGQAWCAVLTRHLGASGRHGDDLRHGRRWAVAHRIARRFAAYAAQRPAMLASWEAGDDTDGLGSPIDPDLAWQPELWRRLAAAVAVPTPSKRLDQVIEQVSADPGSIDLPQRFALFGHTRMPVTEVRLLGALAGHREVGIWLPHASDALWHALQVVAQDGQVPRDDDQSHLTAAHPLLATWGRDVRELQRTLAPLATTAIQAGAPVERPTTVLGRLQSDIEANRAPSGGDTVDPGDHSVQVHACHGPARQVEVLREVLLGLLADDPSLEPRDIVVMCPDIEQYAPLVEAAFGLGGVADDSAWHPGQRLQVRLADRSLVQTNPLLDVIGRLLDLAGARAEASAVLDLAGTAPVRRRFGFSDDDLATLGRWVDRTGVRWAFDAPHRDAFDLGGYVQNTWRFGLDRLLAGVAVSADAGRYFGTTLPYDDVGSSDIDLVGRFAELVDRLRDVTDRLTGSHPVATWVETLRDGLGALTDVGWGDEWQQHQAERELAAIGAEQSAGRPAAGLRLSLSDVRALLGARLVGRPTRANFRTGTLTVCTMVPMRSVPHRVVCLLGIDDGVFPRAGSLDGDDVLARRPLTGERDPRSEDRQLLLDAMMAAREHLVITYSGADEVTGRPRPPAVPVGELLDAVDATFDDGRSHVVVHHPLQSFDARNFRPGVLGTVHAFSFDEAARRAALAARSERSAIPALGGLALPPVPVRDLELPALGAFLRAPVKEFLRRRLMLNVFEDDDEVLDAMPIELDGLQQWSVGDRLLRDRLRGLSADEALQREWRRGVLPPGRLGWHSAQAIGARVDPIVAKAMGVRGDRERSSVEVDIDLGGDRRLRGTVADVFGDRVVGVSYSSLGARHHLDAWLPLLALTLMYPDTPWTAGTVARSRDGADLVVFSPIDPEQARLHLTDLVALHDLGMARPLRLPLKTGFALVHRGERGGWGARSEWEGGRFAGERDSDLHPEVWGPAAPFEILRDADPSLSIDALAERLWRPVLDRVVRA